MSSCIFCVPGNTKQQQDFTIVIFQLFRAMKDKVVISLSSIPPRFKDLGKALKCLLDQDHQADEIQLFIPRYYRRFPQHAFAPPPEVPPGVALKIVDEDLGPATKVLYCAREHWGTETRIIYCDDDRLPERDWLKSFVSAAEKSPDKAIVSTGWHLTRYGIHTSNERLPRAVKLRVMEDYAYMGGRINQKLKEFIFRKPHKKPSRINCRKPGYIDIAAGYGGVLIKPEFFDKNAFDIPPIVWTVDDVWLSGLLELKGIGIWQDNSIRVPINISDIGTAGLGGSVIEDYDRDAANKLAIRYFQDNHSIWKESRLPIQGKN